MKHPDEQFEDFKKKLSKKGAEIKGNRAEINNFDSIAMRRARHFHDLFIMACIANGGKLKITTDIWEAAAKFNAIKRETLPDGSYLFYPVREESN